MTARRIPSGAALVVALGCAPSSPPESLAPPATVEAPTYPRISEADRALLPPSATLPAWFRAAATQPRPPAWDPFYEGALVVSATDYGAIPDDGKDDTAAIQAAYDVACARTPWDMTPRALTDPHGFVVLDPGVYHVVQLHACAGSTLHGYGATLRRPGWRWWLDRHDGDEAAARAEAGSSAARMINGWGYHPRIEYRWRGAYSSPWMRFVGIELDGNLADGWPPWTDYQFWNAHLAVFDATGEGGVQEDVGNLRVELVDVTARQSPADCVAVVSNVVLRARRYQTDGCFRGAITSLGNNNALDVAEAYFSGPPANHRGFDREPQGTSIGYDLVTGEDWTLAQRSAREYWHIRDVVMASSGMDIASSVIPESSTTAQGGALLFERVYVLRPHTFNLLQYGGNADGSPTLTIRDSWIRGGVINGFTIGTPDGAWWALSNVRWSKRIRIEDSELVLAAPSDALLRAHFASAPPWYQTLYPIMIALDQTTLASRQWPHTSLELVNVRFSLDPAWAASAYRDRVKLIAVRQNGNAAQQHRLIWRGGVVDPGFDFGLYQSHGGKVELEAPVGSVYACAYAPQNWTSRIERSGAGLEVPIQLCAGDPDVEITP